jgi:uncharacterized protein (TIGR02145 family)
MAENLAFSMPKTDFHCGLFGKCYLYDPRYEKLYGRLYTWDQAMIVSPPGWHLPTKAEWNDLSKFIDIDKLDKTVDNLSGKALKSNYGWNSGGNGTNQYGFSALPGGYGNSDGDFCNAGSYGNWWSANEYNSSLAYHRDMNYFSGIAHWYSDLKSYLFSVRCVQDAPQEAE